MIGAKFGRLTVLAEVKRGEGKDRHTAWECRCECGTVITTKAYSVKSGHTASCGCLNRDRVSETHRRHGMSYHQGYINWQNMIQRCENPNVPSFSRYGGRGIRVCDRWKTWEHFYADMGERPSPQHSLDRIDNDGNYEPGNCRWATASQQNFNTRRSIAKREASAVIDSIRKSESVPPLLRVAAVQLPRLEAADRTALLPYVKRDMPSAVERDLTESNNGSL